jgi:chemotaxis protein MotA
MKVIIGILIVIGCILLGYLIAGGHLDVLWQPAEFIIIFGASIGAFVISNPGEVLKSAPGALGAAFKGPKYGKKDFLEMLSLLYILIKLIKNKGTVILDSHIDNPKESPIFQNYPLFMANHRAQEFLCDYLRMMTMGSDNPHQMDDIMEKEIEKAEHEFHSIVSAFQNMADGMPALGIVAAVLGVIHTMGSISQPPEILGKLIGAALVGTFAGVLLAYGFIGPLSQAIKASYDAEIAYLNCLRSLILAYLNGYAPLIAVEYARKTIDEHHRPSFVELEQVVSQIPDPS